MLTSPSLSPIQHCSPATDLFVARSESSSPRSLTRALRFSTNNDFFQKSSKPADPYQWSASLPRMASNARSSPKGKERDVFDSLESEPFGKPRFPHLV